MSEAAQEVFSYNPEKARQLLAEAGYPDGFQANIIVSSAGTEVDRVSIIAAMWEKVGVHLVIQPKESVVYSSIQAANSHEDMIWSTTMRHKAFMRWATFSPAFNCSYIDEEYIKRPLKKATFKLYPQSGQSNFLSTT